ncbi:hypothetical protein BaRGS_00019593 [Batillaria attramentaria]|uniref:Uncharacterized protein n=1 Tax=Batillaria attramentaria TaxID=370345 RepID=A0ABD0KQ63_9CAEN
MPQTPDKLVGSCDEELGHKLASLAARHYSEIVPRITEGPLTSDTQSSSPKLTSYSHKPVFMRADQLLSMPELSLLLMMRSHEKSFS